MNCKTPDDVRKAVKDSGVNFIQCWFTDVLGVLKSFTITPSELDEALDEGMGFDGSSIEGFARIEESDLIAKPDPTTFQFLPWENSDRKVGRIFCDILYPDKSPYQGDPRYVLRRMADVLEKKGYTGYAGPELEYFYLKNNRCAETLDDAGYFDSIPLDISHSLRMETVSTLQSMGIQVEYEHHEVAPGQHEIDLRYDEIMRMADKAMTYRVVVKEIARRGGCYATFMPKPIFGENGSGMHV
ncbi:MAG: glutamine synthetase family protein, partial [bacterium]